MRKRFWVCSCLFVFLLVGCGKDDPPSEPPGPPPKTEEIKKPDGSTEIKSSDAP